MKTIDARCMPSMIDLGYKEENNWRPVPFDCSCLFEKHPGGVMTLWVQPEGKAQAFPVALERGEGDVYVWTPLDEEITALRGKLQLVCVDGTDVGKSAVAHWRVGDSIVPGAEHPEDQPSWAAEMIARAEDAARRAEEAAESIDIDPEAVEKAVAAYLEEHPVEGEPGPSAYELAVEQGYTGTLEEWLASLHGRDGTNGKDGADGKDGVSPAVSVSAVTGGHAVTITDKDHPNGQTFNVMDGKDGQDGQDGAPGPQGPAGQDGSDYVLTNQDKSDIAGMAKDLMQIDADPTPGSTNPVSSGGAAAALQGKVDQTETVTMTAADTAVTLLPNKFYIFPEMSSLTITCPATGGPFAFRFTSGAAATTLSLTGITMPDDFSVEAETVYEINVYEGYGLAVSWEVGA